MKQDTEITVLLGVIFTAIALALGFYLFILPAHAQASVVNHYEANNRSPLTSTYNGTSFGHHDVSQAFTASSTYGVGTTTLILSQIGADQANAFDVLGITYYAADGAYNPTGPALCDDLVFGNTIPVYPATSTISFSTCNASLINGNNYVFVLSISNSGSRDLEYESFGSASPDPVYNLSNSFCEGIIGSSWTCFDYVQNYQIEDGGTTTTPPFVCSGTPTTTLVFPQASGTYPEFTNWVVHHENLCQLDVYGPLANVAGVQFSTNLSAFNSSSPTFSNKDIGELGITDTSTIRKTFSFLQNLLPVEQWYARAFVFYYSSSSTRNFIQSDVVPFTIDLGAYKPTSTDQAILLAGPFQILHAPVFETPTSTPQLDCLIYPMVDSYAGIPFLADTAGQRIYCETQNFINSLIDAIKTNSAIAFNNAIGGFKSIFPINIITAINNDIVLAQASSTNPQPIVLVGNANVFMGRSMTIYNASSTSWIKDNTGFDIQAIISLFLYAGTGMIILGMSLKTFNNMHNSV